jgi:hypothetical protein
VLVPPDLEDQVEPVLIGNVGVDECCVEQVPRRLVLQPTQYMRNERPRFLVDEATCAQYSHWQRLRYMRNARMRLGVWMVAQMDRVLEDVAAGADCDKLLVCVAIIA